MRLASRAPRSTRPLNPLNSQGCGNEGGACCPGTPPYCKDPDTACLPSNVSAAADNQETGDAVCRRYTQDTCGQADGLCQGGWGSWPPGPVPRCPQDKQICPAGCAVWRGGGWPLAAVPVHALSPTPPFAVQTLLLPTL